MINVYHVAGAAPIAMFGMFTLWAAASKRHWFVRKAVRKSTGNPEFQCGIGSMSEPVGVKHV
jgi:hypothetical protein